MLRNFNRDGQGARRFPPRFGQRLAMMLPKEVVNFPNINCAHREPDLVLFRVRGCRPLIHSRIAHESRTRVFTLTFLASESRKGLIKSGPAAASANFFQAGSFESTISWPRTWTVSLS